MSAMTIKERFSLRRHGSILSADVDHLCQHVALIDSLPLVPPPPPAFRRLKSTSSLEQPSHVRPQMSRHHSTVSSLDATPVSVEQMLRTLDPLSERDIAATSHLMIDNETDLEDSGSTRKQLAEDDKREEESLLSSGATTKATPETQAAPPTTTFVLAFGFVLVGGLMSNISFEKLNQLDPGCGTVLSILQYLAAIVERMPEASTYLTRPVIPVTYHALFVLLMLVSIYASNASLAYDLPFAQFLVIKNSNLLFSMMVSFLLLKRRYVWGQILSVAMLTIGIVVSVLSQQESDHEDEVESEERQTSNATVSSTMMGVILCTVSALCMACLGCIQEHAFSLYKMKDGHAATSEALFYTHAFSLPFFFTRDDTKHHILALVEQWKHSFVLIFWNLASVTLLKSGIFQLMDLSSSLTTTLAITMARFLGIVLSACFLSGQPLPSGEFWIGSGLVVLGSVAYLIVGSRFGRSRRPSKAV